jgi:hypothetical protein
VEVNPACVCGADGAARQPEHFVQNNFSMLKDSGFEERLRLYFLTAAKPFCIWWKKF